MLLTQLLGAIPAAPFYYRPNDHVVVTTGFYVELVGLLRLLKLGLL